jgi:hypothetical protein
MLRLSIVDVADHIERFKRVYMQAVHDPADGGVYEALVRHFAEYAWRLSPGARTRAYPVQTTTSGSCSPR